MTSISRQVVDIKYQEYLNQVQDLNSMKEYLRLNHSVMSKETLQMMTEHIVERQGELERIEKHHLESFRSNGSPRKRFANKV
jgi:hypothetical protein